MEVNQYDDMLGPSDQLVPNLQPHKGTPAMEPRSENSDGRSFMLARLWNGRLRNSSRAYARDTRRVAQG